MKKLLMIGGSVPVALVLAIFLVIPALAGSPAQSTELSEGTAIIPLAQNQGGCIMSGVEEGCGEGGCGDGCGDAQAQSVSNLN